MELSEKLALTEPEDRSSSKWLKCVLCLMNFSFFFGGIFLGIFALSSLLERNVLYQLILISDSVVLRRAFIILLVGACLLLINAALGLFGVTTENRYFLSICLILNSIGFGIFLTTLVYIFIKFNDMKMMLLSVISSNAGCMKSDPLFPALKLIEESFRCCGVNGPGDYHCRPIPTSCYGNSSVFSNSSHYRSGEALFTSGCASYSQLLLDVAGGVGLFVLIMEIPAALLAAWLISRLKNSQAHTEYPRTMQ
ncbi:unnamed protein product [Clavelina lepadiformis]|uniref:Tetraspanin n=1 Tax=Clavelina lepadiformis TaxID=159417 RepID=A0ABP0FSE7_CLALP